MENLIPRNIMESVSFKDLFDLKTPTRDSVLVFNKETKVHEKKQIYRSYMNYLSTPKFDEKINKSYMFVNMSDSLPEQLKPFLDFVKKIDPRYNQLSVSWYENDDFIEPHRDCVAKMLNPDSPILVINLNESNDISKARNMVFQNVKTGEVTSIPLLNGRFYIIENNSTHRHSVGKGLERRISLTFRMMQE